jgi:hypothetical protein
MGRFLVKLEQDGRGWYLEWSNIVDAPTTWGMDRAELSAYYVQRYGSEGAAKLPELLELADRTGCSIPHVTIDEVIASNCAGDDDETLTREQIIKKYCIDRDSRRVEE